MLRSVVARAFYLVNREVYFIVEATSFNQTPYIQFLNLATGRQTSVVPVSRPGVGLSVSPDSRSILFTKWDEAGSDLMLVENFR